MSYLGVYDYSTGGDFSRSVLPWSLVAGNTVQLAPIADDPLQSLAPSAWSGRTACGLGQLDTSTITSALPYLAAAGAGVWLLMKLLGGGGRSRGSQLRRAAYRAEAERAAILAGG